MHTKLAGTVLSLLILAAVLPADLAAEKRGAQLEIRMLDGRTIVGELIAVREDKLVLKDEATSADVTMSIIDVRTVTDKINADSHLGGIGALLGALGGMAVGSALGSAKESEEKGFSSGGGVFIGAFFGAMIGGGLVSLMTGRERGPHIYARGETLMQDALIKLRSMAAIREAN
jgi:hypothetical protein